MSDQFFWYVTRSAALITWLSAALAILIGLMTSSRLLGRRPTIPWLVDLHRMFAGISVTFLGVHMVSLWLDSFVRFRFGDLLIPWVATVPGLTRTSIALGVIAAWSMAAVQGTSIVRDRMPERVWRAIHMLSFATLGFGTLHGLQAGSDAGNPIVVAIGVSVLTAIVLATLVRLVRLRQPAGPETSTAAASAPGSQDQSGGPSLGQPGSVLGQPGSVLGQPGSVLGQPGPVLGQPESAVGLNGSNGAGTMPRPVRRRQAP